MIVARHRAGEQSEHGRDPESSASLEAEVARSRIAALEQLLEVYESTSLEQTQRLERALREREALLASSQAAELALLTSEQRLRLALDAGSMGTWEWDIAGGRVHWSPEEERLYGMEPGSFTGTLEEYREHIHPDDREASLALVRDAIDRRADTHHVLHRILRSGREVRWLESHARFLYADDGTPQRLVGVSIDVTDRRRLEEARDAALAQASAERQRLFEVFMQAPAAISVVEGREHRFTVANPRYRQLVGDRELLGRTVREAFPDIAELGLFEMLDQVFRTGEPFAASELLVRLDRSGTGQPEDVYVDFVYQPLRELDGTTFGIMVHAVDVTDQVRARHQVEQKADELTRLAQELERSNRDLDQFAYVASHDLKAPLRGIANLTQWIEEDLGARVTGESLQHMHLLKGRVQRMEALIEGVLTYSRAGRGREKVERVDAGALVVEVVELLAPREDAHVDIAPGLPVLETERVPLQQVFMNLIGNALKYNTAPDAEVRVDAAAEEGWYHFTVADNGPGIAPQYREKIWQIFQTLAARDKVEGTGIGLSVVKKIVEARGGRAWVDSEPGQGSTFHFTWPSHQEREP